MKSFNENRDPLDSALTNNQQFVAMIDKYMRGVEGRDPSAKFALWENYKFNVKAIKSELFSVLYKLDSLYEDYIQKYGQADFDTNKKKIISIILKNFKNSTAPYFSFGYEINLSSVDTDTINWEPFMEEINKTLKWIETNLRDGSKVLKELSKVTQNDFGIKHVGDKVHKPNTKTKTKFRRNEGRTDRSNDPCYVCGYTNHTDDVCKFKSHPDANNDPSKSFKDSEKGKRYEQLKRSLSQFKQLDSVNNTLIDRKKSESSSGTTNNSGNRSSNPANKERRGKRLNIELLNLDDLTISDELHLPILQARIPIKEKEEAKVRVLLDTGASSGNYITTQLYEMLIEAGNAKQYPCNIAVCSLFNNSCIHCKTKIELKLTIFNELNDEFEIISILACPLDTLSGVDVILGYKEVVRHNMTEKAKSLFQNLTLLNENELNQPEAENNRGLDGIMERQIFSDTLYELDSFLLNTDGKVPSSYWFDKTETIEDVFDEDDIELKDLLPTSDSDEHEFNSEEGFQKLLELLHLNHLTSDHILIKLIKKYPDIFSTKIRREPAKLEPMVIEVDESKWRCATNRTSARPLPPDRTQAVQEMVTEYKSSNIIEYSEELYHSHISLVPKPDDTWRFCIDFRRLNAATKKMSWPIPNIQQILERIGIAKPNIFALLDCTKGFFQCLIAEACRKYTAFVTHNKKFQFQRVAMGLTGAPAYFQKQIAETLLKDLLNFICEQYLDDILVYAQGLPQLCERLELIFQRFRKYNLTLNPKKCVFGVEKIQFLGRLIDGTGIKMPQQKVDQIINFDKPTTKGQLKSFIGVINYFHQFVPNLSHELKPLQDLLINYTRKARRRPIEWSEASISAFEKVKSLIFNSNKLYYLTDGDPVYLMTDASQYGIGAYLYQKRSDNNHYPIAYLSKTLRKEQLNWSTIEKEAYAIFYSIKHFGYILKGINFTLLTDHANLTYISNNCSSKVVHWKLAIQEYSFDVKHIKGENNVIADFLSRTNVPESGIMPELENIKRCAVTKLTNEEISSVIAKFLAKVPTLEGLKEQINELKEFARVANQQKMSNVATSSKSEPIDQFKAIDRFNDNNNIPIQPVIRKIVDTKRAKRLKRLHLITNEEKGINNNNNTTTSKPLNQNNYLNNRKPNWDQVSEKIQSSLELLNAFLPDCEYSDEQRNIMTQVHNSNVGHFGVERTIKRLKELGHNWQYMRLHVRKFIHLCPVCEKMSEKNIVTVTRPYTVANLRPMEQLHVDFIGPINVEGNNTNYVLVVLDSFTRFVELFPTPNNTAKTALECLIHHFGRYGTPLSIKTDGGSEFISDLNEQLSKTAQFAKIKTTAYSKQENSIVERANKEVFRHLRGILYDEGMTYEWDKYLPFVQRIMNASTHSSLGVSPAQLLFGNSIDLDRGILYDDSLQTNNSSESSEINLSDWITEKLEVQKKLLNIAKKHQVEVDTTNTINRANFKEITGKTDFPINSYVLARYKSSLKNNRAPSKVLMPWRGPFRVVDKQGDTYTIHNLPEDKYEEYHVSFLKPFVYDPNVTDPRLVANKDVGFFDIERVLAHTGKDKKVSTYKFLIRWKGYDPSHDKWEPWENVRNNLVVHKYLKDNKLASLIPQKFKVKPIDLNENNANNIVQFQ